MTSGALADDVAVFLAGGGTPDFRAAMSAHLAWGDERALEGRCDVDTSPHPVPTADEVARAFDQDDYTARGYGASGDLYR